MDDDLDSEDDEWKARSSVKAESWRDDDDDMEDKDDADEAEGENE